VDTFIQLTLNGLTLGSVYALIALGYSLVYGILKLLNFAHGDVFMVGTFIGFGALQVLGGSKSPVVPVSFFLAYSMQLMFGADLKNYDAFSLADGALYFNGFDIGNVRVPLLRIITIVSAFVMMLLLWLLVTRTRIGKAMRATSHDREAAAMMGIDIDRVIVFAFVLGSALAGAGGVLFALRVPTYATIGFLIGLKGFTAAVIGGIGSIPGAMAGGLLLGFAESYTQGYVSTRWSDLFVFVILILFLLFRPQGILGKADIRKV
jgi:branched-chain amino acid transport system permease protein